MVKKELEQQIDLETVKAYFNSGFCPQISFVLDCKKVKVDSDNLKQIIDSIKGVQSLMPLLEYNKTKQRLVFETLMLHEDRNSFNSTGLNNFFFSDKEIGFPRGVIVLELVSNKTCRIGNLLEDLIDYMKLSPSESKISECFKISWKGCETD